METPQRTTRDTLAAGQTLARDVGALRTAGPSGAIWGLNAPQLNANLVTVRSGDSINAHRNDEVDVLLIGQTGHGTVIINEEAFALKPDVVIYIPTGAVRSVQATTDLLYYSVHQRRRGMLQPK